MSRELTLKQLRYFSALADCENYRKAAEQCGISQPSLSAQIDGLEAHLGVRLAERGRRGAQLTPVGREVLARTHAILREVQALEDYASEAMKTLSGTLQFGVKTSVGPYLMPPVVRRLHREYPQLRLRIREDFSEPLAEQLLNGVHDLILTEMPAGRGDLVTRELFEEPLLMICANDHPLAGEGTVALKDLRGVEALSFSSRSQYHRQIDSFCKKHGLEINARYDSASLDALRLMAGMGTGVCFLPYLYVASEIEGRGDVIARPIEGEPLTRRIGLAWRKSTGTSPAIRRIGDAILRDLERHHPNLKRLDSSKLG